VRSPGCEGKWRGMEKGERGGGIEWSTVEEESEGWGGEMM